MIKFLLLLNVLLSMSSVHAQASQELSLYFIPAPVRLDWSSPANLAISAAKSRLSFKSRFLGHVFVEIKCGETSELTGMVGKNFDYLNQLLIQQKGLGILFHSFDGQLENKDDVAQEIQELSQTGERLNFVRFKLNEKQCQRAARYLKEYREMNVGRYYGLANRPRYGEGAGCSAFGASFVDVLSLFDGDIARSWSQTVHVPLKFAGPPLKDEGTNLFTLIMNASSWAKEGDESVPLTFWSPDYMFEWVQKNVNQPHEAMKVVELNKSKGIELDRSYLPAPEESVWKPNNP